MSTPLDLANALQNFVNVMLSAITDPAVAVQIFSDMAQFPQPSDFVLSPIGTAQQSLSSAISDVSRRVSIGALAQAASYYQPVSYNDAANLRANICAIIDNEIQIAGDQGQDQTFLALKQVRAVVVQDLTTRGATLAAVVTKNYKAPLPALVVAYRLYQDISRTDQVISFANPPHPAFMPLTFPALAS